jgi:hypothetical protein
MNFVLSWWLADIFRNISGSCYMYISQWESTCMYLSCTIVFKKSLFCTTYKVPSRLMLHNSRRGVLEKMSTAARTALMPELGKPRHDGLRYPWDGTAIGARMAWTPRWGKCVAVCWPAYRDQIIDVVFFFIDISIVGLSSMTSGWQNIWSKPLFCLVDLKGRPLKLDAFNLVWPEVPCYPVYFVVYSCRRNLNLLIYK